MTDTPVALIVFLALDTVAAVVLALLLVRSRQESNRLRQRSVAAETERDSASRHSADLGTRLHALEAELRHLSSARIPDLAASLIHSDVRVRGPLGTASLSPDLDRSIGSVLTQVGEEVTKERRRVDFAAQASMRGSTTTIQALLYQLQTLLQRMQEKYDDPLVAEDLLTADFLNEQALRRIQSTAVVCGAWPGLTRENSHLADIVVGAMSRLSGYERVQVTNQLRDPVGVVARAVEPVAVTVTELMANALHYSHPDLPVVVTLQQGNRGVSVIIDDAGVGMHSDELTRAKRLMAGEGALLITELGDPPRNGFAAIGQLVRQYGFSTHVEASPYGGVRAIVHIPGEPLLTMLDDVEQPMSAMSPTPPEGTPVLPGRAATDRRPPAPASADELGNPPGEEELPRRRRRQPTGVHEPQEQTDGTSAAGAAGSRTGVSPAQGSSRGGLSGKSPSEGGAGPAITAPAAPHPTPEESALLWSAFQQGTASGRAAVDSGAGRQPAAGAEPPGPDGPAALEPADSDTGPDGAGNVDPRASEGNPPA